MTISQRFSFPLVFVLLLFYEIFWMYPKSPVISFPSSLYVVLFLVTFVAVLWNGDFFRKSASFYSFVVLDILVIFFSYEHSLLCPFDSRFFYFTIPLPLLLFLYSYNLTLVTKNLLPNVASATCFVLAVIYLVDRNANMGLKDLLSVDAGSYTILYYVPFVLCLKSRTLKIGMLLLCVVTVLLSFKRGGTICVFGGILVYAMFAIAQGNDWLKKAKRIYFASIALILVLLIFYYINGSFNDYLFDRFSQIEEGGGSGRTKIYAHVLEMIESSTLFELIVGHGYNAVLKDNYQGFSAHNDFLECVYDYGMITFFAYIALYVNLIRLCLRMLIRKSFYAAPLAASIMMFLLNSFVSHILLYEWFLSIFALFWGFVIACDERERLEPLKRAGGVYTDVVYINKEKSNEKGNVGFWNQTGSNQDLSSGQ